MDSRNLHFLNMNEEEMEEHDRLINTQAALERARLRTSVNAEILSWSILSFALGVLVGCIVMLWIAGGF